MKTCLVVDDSKVVRKISRRIMENLSFSVREAENGQEAFESCEKSLPNVILLDWNMPVMDGLTCLKKIRSLPKSKDTVVIFCTTENDLGHIQSAIEASANEYIMKPFDEEILKSKLAQTGVL